MKKLNLTKRTWRYKIRPIRIEGDTAFITLTRGMVAIIDAVDVPLVEGWNWCAMPAGNDKWYAYSGGYRKIRLHQFLFPAPLGLMTDHRDRNGLNNRRSNLRHATPSQNSQNKPRPRMGIGKFKGVSFRGNGRWRARIVVAGQRIILGTFISPEQAALAYDTAARGAFGEFAVLNFSEALTVMGDQIGKFDPD